MIRAHHRAGLPVACLLLATLLAGACWAQDGAAAARPDRATAIKTYEARKLLAKADELLKIGERDRGVRMLETIIQQHADTPVRFEAYLAMGRYFLQQHDPSRAIAALRHLRDLAGDEKPLAGSTLEMYLEGLYLTGTGYFQMKQYGSAFPILRKITVGWPNTVWANQAYYYVGMCHFAQGNWSKAIQALSLVGTFVDPDSPTVSYVEAGRRFYVKIADRDLPILHRLGQKVTVTVTTASGDTETVTCIPLSLDSGLFLASVPTAIGKAVPGDNVLQVIGGDKITTRYVDANAKDGRKNVERTQTVEVVSTGTLVFSMGTFEGQSPAAFVSQPLCVLLTDVDLDRTDAAEKIKVKVVSRYKVDRDDSDTDPAASLRADLTLEEELKYETRDEVIVELTELGPAPVHSGRFGAAVVTQGSVADRPVVKNDAILTCEVGDEIIATYVDTLHIGGHSQRTAQASIPVAGEITSQLGTSVNFVADPVLRAKKNAVEATAYLELTRIFASMGLKKGAAVKAAAGLKRVDNILTTDSPIPSALKEEAFKLRWNLFLATEDFPRAMATCQLFSRLYPNSPFADQAMMGIADIRLRNKDYALARKVYSQVLALRNSMAKPEAQFRIAQTIETEAAEAAAKRNALAAARGGGAGQVDPPPSEAAIRAYKRCAERYPESRYAGQSLGKLVGYYLHAGDYARADDLLEQIFQDYPDGDFLDAMLLKWVDVARRTGNTQKAYDKCSQLIFEYPASPHAAKAKAMLPVLKGLLEGGSRTE